MKHEFWLRKFLVKNFKNYNEELTRSINIDFRNII